MYYHESKNSKWTKFLSGRGFYAVLAVCMVAIGVAGYIAVARLNITKPTDEPDDSTSYRIDGGLSQIQLPDEPQSQAPVDKKAESEAYESSAPQQTNTKPVANYFVLPMTGEVLKDFSDTQLQYSNTYNDMRMHLGIDIAPNSGTTVKSAGDGAITDISDTADYGIVVTVDHGNGITARYCGLKNTAVEKGGAVTAGQPLGELGTVPCECVDKAHLHFEVYKDNKPVSPFELTEAAGQ